MKCWMSEFHLSRRLCASQPELWVVVEDESSRLLTWEESNPILRPVSLTSDPELLHCQRKLEASSAATVVGRDGGIVVVEVLEEL